MSTNGIEGCWAYVPVRQAPAKMDMDRIFFMASMIIHVFIIKIQHLDRHIVGRLCRAFRIDLYRL